jgi:hypothetical protein
VPLSMIEAFAAPEGHIYSRSERKFVKMEKTPLYKAPGATADNPDIRQAPPNPCVTARVGGVAGSLPYQAVQGHPHLP